MVDRTAFATPITRLKRRHAALLLFTCPWLWRAGAAFGQDAADFETLGLEPDNPMTAVTTRYQALASYQDRGTLKTRYQWPGTPATGEVHRFETAYRQPRNFFFRFDQDPASGGDAYVIWCDGGPFQSWWKSTGSHTVHDNGQGAMAFLNGQWPTKDAADIVAPHMFPQAQLLGPAYRLIAPQELEMEDIDGKRCRKIAAVQRVSGTHTVDRRPSTVWVEEDTSLIRKVLVGPDEGSPPDFVDDREFLLEAEADPELPDGRFTFAPPG